MSYLLHISRNPIVRIAYKGCYPVIYPFFVHPEPKYENINIIPNNGNSLLSFPVGLYRKYERNISKTKFIKIYLTNENPATFSSTKRFFNILSGLKEPVFLEIISMNDEIFWQIAVQEKDINLIKTAIKVTNPDATVLDIDSDIIREHYDQIKYSEKRNNYEFNF